MHQITTLQKSLNQLLGHLSVEEIMTNRPLCESAKKIERMSRRLLHAKMHC